MNKKIFAIDPGTEKSAFVLYEDKQILDKGILQNDLMQLFLMDMPRNFADIASIEFVQSYGMPVGREIFLTAFWCGKFALLCEQKGTAVKLIARPKIKAFITGLAKSKDADIRRSLILIYGGTKKGEPLHGITKDIWSALAVAYYTSEGLKTGRLEEW